MAEEPTPTYRVEQGGDEEEERFVCLIPDAGKDDGVCGMVCRTLEYMTDHMQQRHSGIMAEETESAHEDAPPPTDGQQDAAPTSGTTAEADPISTPRTPDSQEAPPRGTPTPLPPPTPTHPIVLPEEPPSSDAEGNAA